MLQKNKLFFLFFVFILNLSSFSQSVLEQKISIPKKKYNADEFLNFIEKNSNARFSYNSDLIDKNKNFVYYAENKEIKLCLDDVFNQKIKYKSSGKYIILLENTETTKSDKKKYLVKGKITNPKDKPIKNVSVYDVNEKYSTITDNKGEFSLNFNSENDYSGLSIGKFGYQDTVIIYNTKLNDEIKIELKPQDSIQLSKKRYINKSYEIDNIRFANYLIPKKIKLNSQNLKHINDIRPFQISFLPGISSNLAKFGVLKNNVSLNILIGYTRGVEGVEFAGLMNFDKEDVRWIQFAGLSNLVGGKVTGLQAGGITNVVLNDFYGIQFGGISNFVIGNFNGIQTAGTSNITIGDFYGLQTAGIANLNTGKFKGLQTAGIVSANFKDFSGLQLSGLLNFNTGNLKGLQISGFSNINTDSLSGCQISSFLNDSETADFQLSGFLNIAKHNKGVQIAPFNFCDTSSGVPIGFLSVVLKGYHNIIFSFDEINYLNANIHLGTENFYNIFNFGHTPNNKNIWSFGYGIGHKFKFNTWAKLDLELMTKNLYYNKSFYNSWFPYHKISLIFDFKIANLFSVYLGASANYYIWFNDKQNQESLNYISQTMNVPLSYNQTEYFISKSWIGFYFGIGF